jgi:hypothetical protein
MQVPQRGNQSAFQPGLQLRLRLVAIIPSFATLHKPQIPILLHQCLAEPKIVLINCGNPSTTYTQDCLVRRSSDGCAGPPRAIREVIIGRNIRTGGQNRHCGVLVVRWRLSPLAGQRRWRPHRRSTVRGAASGVEGRHQRARSGGDFSVDSVASSISVVDGCTPRGGRQRGRQPVITQVAPRRAATTHRAIEAL